MKKIIFFLICVCLSSCQRPCVNDAIVVSIPLEKYSKQEQVEILHEKSTLPENSIIRTKVLPDWARMRADIKAGN